LSFLLLRGWLWFGAVSRRVFDFESGECAAAPFFLLLAQKKEGKEKGTLLTRPAAVLRVLSLTGARQLAAAQTRLASLLSGTAMLDALEGKQCRIFQPHL
jgi:hypothetical protein